MKKNKTTIAEENLTSFIEAEGGVSCAFVLYVFLWRLWYFCTTLRSTRIAKDDLEGQKKCGGLFFWFSIGIFWANFGVSVAGMCMSSNMC
jgi:hypothetical protein